MEYRQSVATGSPIGAGTAIVDESASRIRDGISGSEQALSELQDAIDRLERRLDTVLTPQPPASVNANMPKPSPVGSHVVGRLEILNEGFQYTIQRLRDISRRIEV